ncbi:MAG: response regulator, partial [Desulfovibrionaceae bacterium]|nr:response regulator [Desulfovibrionaceae bacterium]
FYFTARLARATQAEDSLNADANAEAADMTGRFQGRTMLLAEDVEINREIVLALLEDTGICIDCAENGQQALDMFLATPDRYDIIFMDIQMPELDGVEATRRIRSLSIPRATDIPIFAVTANVFSEDIARYLETGMNGCISKPLDLEKMQTVLCQCLGDARGTSC